MKTNDMNQGIGKGVQSIPSSRRQFLRTGGLAAVALVARPHIAQGYSNPRRRVKVGQIGTAHAHASGKMAAMRALPDEYEVVGVVEPDSELRARAQERRTYANLPWLTEEQLLNIQGLEAVAVETRVCDLVSTAARCVAAGMHIHLDKPAGESLSAFRRVLEEAERKHVTVQMGYMFRENPAFRFCFEALRQGWLGDVFEVHGVISSNYGPGKRKTLLDYRGGIIFELGCHLIDAVVAVLGKPGDVTGYTRRVRSEWDDFPDNQLAVFEYPKATATVRSTLLEVVPRAPSRRRQFVVCGDKGTVDIRPLEPPRVQLTLASAQADFERGFQEVEFPATSRYGRYGKQLLTLAEIVRGEREPEYSASHDLAVQEAVLRASGLPVDD